MMRWNLDQSLRSRKPEHSAFSLEWECDQPNVSWFHGVSVGTPGSGEASVDATAVYFRMVCHWVLDAISDAGLSEAYQSLGEIYEFYRPTFAIAKPQMPQESTAAVMGDVTERPTFTIDEE